MNNLLSLLVPDEDGIYYLSINDMFYDRESNLPKLAFSKNCVYIIYNKDITSGYIGETKNLFNRFRTIGSAHRKAYVNGWDYELYQELWKYGLNNFYVGILESNVPEDFSREIYWISLLKDELHLYNQTSGGLSGDQFHSEKLKSRYNGKLPFNTDKVYVIKIINSVLNDFDYLKNLGIEVNPITYYYNNDYQRLYRRRRVNRIINHKSYLDDIRWPIEAKELFQYYINNGIPSN